LLLLFANVIAAKTAAPVHSAIAAATPASFSTTIIAASLFPLPTTNVPPPLPLLFFPSPAPLHLFPAPLSSLFSPRRPVLMNHSSLQVVGMSSQQWQRTP
jgi:hypothetical protein